jgi:hypothetical protein
VRSVVAALVLIALAAAPVHATADEPNPLLGSWRLVAAIPANEQDSSPNGIRNLRLRFGADGKATLVDPSETLAESKASNDYTLDGSALSLKLDEDRVLHGVVEPGPGEARTIRFVETGMAWTLQRIDDKLLETRVAPESVEYLPPATAASAMAFRYDDADYSKLPVAERLVGQWDVVEISGYGAGDFPPYGAPNETWVFDGRQLTRHDRHHPDEPVSSEYHVTGGTLLGKGGAVPFSFDAWGRLVVGEPDGMRTVLRRINRDGAGKVQIPPLRIVLGYPAD